MLRLPLRLVALIIALAVPLAAPAEDAGGQDASHDAQWLKKTTQVCAGCHGPEGAAQTPDFPIIAGQYRNYLLYSMQAYRDGGRENAIMAGQVQGMTDAQLKALAKFYEKQDSPLYTPDLGK